MLVRDARDGGMIKHPLPRLYKGAVRLHDDAVPLTVIHDFSLLTEGVELTKMRFEVSRVVARTLN